MKNLVFDMFYVLMNMFRTYVVFLLIGCFFYRANINKVIESLSFCMYFVVVTLAYLLFDIPILTLGINIIGLFLITMIYKATYKNRILSVVYIYVILIISESMIALLTGYINFPMFGKGDYSSVFGIVCVPIIPFMMAHVIRSYKNIRRSIQIPTSYWITIVTVPSSTIYIIVTLFCSTGVVIYQVFICVVLLLSINVIVFSLYDRQMLAFEQEKKKQLLEVQNRYYESQFELMKSASMATRSLKHDLVNHTMAMQSLLHRSEYEELQRYIQKISLLNRNDNEYASSGNMIVDSILNFKLQEAEQKGVVTKLELYIPEQLKIDSFDMTILLGNLLDNAIYATSGFDNENRKVELSIKYDKGRLIIQTRNDFIGEIMYQGNKIVSSKKDRNNHGFGLSNIENVVKKYQGSLQIQHDEGKFCVTILLYTGT